MALSELIKYEGDNSSFIWKYPGEDFNCMTEIVVNESQEAVFIANGVAADTFGPGRYKLDAKNIPILTGFIDNITGASVFHCQVYYINKTTKMAVKWGTPEKVRFIDPLTGVPLELGASGEMNLAVSDGRKLLIKLVGTMKGISWEEQGSGFTKSLQASFRPLIANAVKTNLSAVIKNEAIDLLEVDEKLDVISGALREKVLPGFEEYGLTVPEFYVTNVVLPEDDPNFKRIRDLHTITLQTRIYQAEATVKTVQAQSETMYRTAQEQSKAAIEAARREAELQRQTTETEIARRAAERTIIEAQAQAQAAQMAGMAEAAVMQAKGYNQKDVIQAEVQKAYAESIGNMGPAITAGGSSGVMGDMLGLGVGMAAMGVMAPQVGEMMKNFGAGAAAAAPNAAAPVQNTAQTVKCHKCGVELPTGAKFCFVCGEKSEVLGENEMICPVCGKKTPKGKFCMECGSPLARKCPTCGADVPQGGKFCLECGTKLD